MQRNNDLSPETAQTKNDKHELRLGYNDAGAPKR
jgi:hypothetical protein